MPRDFALTAAALIAATLLVGCDSLSGEPRMPEPGTPSWERTGSDVVSVSPESASVQPAGPTHWDEEARRRGAKPRNPDYGYIAPGRDVRTSAWRGSDWAEPLPTGDWASPMPTEQWSDETEMAVMIEVVEEEPSGASSGSFVIIEEAAPATTQAVTTSRSSVYRPQAHSTRGSGGGTRITVPAPATAHARRPVVRPTPAPMPVVRPTPAPTPARPSPVVPRRGYTPPPPPR